MLDLKQKMILPGSTLGVFGGGQLGRMFAQASQRLGYQVVVFTDDKDSPAAQVAHKTVVGDFLDPSAVREFASQVDVITLEFENIAIEAVQRAAEVTLVRPGVDILAISQHRLREKNTLRELGFPVTPFHELRDIQQVPAIIEEFGWPLAIKTTSWGYDGKGQRKVRSMIEANDAMELLGPEPLIAEQWINYVAEVSIVIARTASGQIAVYPLFTNTHANHILDVTSCPPSRELEEIAKQADTIARGIADSLQLEGLLCVEFFVSEDGKLMINEIAPRPHNSGHLTIDACHTSQFEQQVRAICNLPLGDTSLIQPAAMVNLLGEIWGTRIPHFERALSETNTHLHLYGKDGARMGRKMGHITVLADSVDQATMKAIQIRESLRFTQQNLF